MVWWRVVIFNSWYRATKLVWLYMPNCCVVPNCLQNCKQSRYGFFVSMVGSTQRLENSSGWTTVCPQPTLPNHQKNRSSTTTTTTTTTATTTTVLLLKNDCHDLELNTGHEERKRRGWPLGQKVKFLSIYLKNRNMVDHLTYIRLYKEVAILPGRVP